MATMRGEKGIVEMFLTGTNIRPSDYVPIKMTAVCHADTSSSQPFVLGKMHLFMLFIMVFHTVALRHRRMCYKCVDQVVESFIL